MIKNLPSVSIVIPTRPGQVEVEAVTASRALDYPREKLEIIVARGKQPSVQRNAAIRQACGPDFVIVTPGIRPAGQSGKDDQARTLTPAEAVAAGATYLVIGRPITGASDPRRAAEAIAAEIVPK